MDLIYISQARIPSEKAHVYQILKTCEAFSKAGCQVELIHPYRVNTKKMKEIKDIWEYYGIKFRFKITRLPSIDLMPLQSINKKIWFLTQVFSFGFVVFFYIIFKKRSRFDIIYGRDAFTIYLLLKFKSLIKAKIVYEDHTYPTSENSFRIKMAKKLDGLVVITKNLRKLYTNTGVNIAKNFLAPDGVDLRRFKAINSVDCNKKLFEDEFLDKKLICYVGHLFKWKGVYTLAEAMKYLSDGCRLVVVGGMDEDIAEYKRFIENKGLKNINCVGYVSPNRVVEYLKISNIVVLPNSIENNISKYYTSPLKLFEYMASKKPIVASDLPSIREILKDSENAILVEPGNPKALADGIKRVIDNPNLAKKISETAYKDVQEYTWDKRAERILEFVERRPN
jgi:glycosyltransferase involved in cell wall biosynthesis